jgi:WD40 repeat protein
MSKNYTDITLENHSGYPEVSAIGSEQVIVSNWAGNLSIVDLNSMKIVKQVFGGLNDYACRTLRSLQTYFSLSETESPEIELFCTVAAQGYGIFWNTKSSEVKKFYSESDGSVSSIAYLPEHDLIALGTGMYPLSDQIRYAYLELWSIESDICLLKVALPGTCVDAIAFSPDGTEIICTTGLRNQKQGFVIRIETETLRLLQIIEVPYVFCTQVRFDINYGEGGNNIYWSSSNKGVFAFNLDEKRELWSIEGEFSNFSLSFNEDEYENHTFLTNGQLVDSYDGEVVQEFEPLDECCSVTTLPNQCGYVGISCSGMLRYWKL